MSHAYPSTEFRPTKMMGVSKVSEKEKVSEVVKGPDLSPEALLNLRVKSQKKVQANVVTGDVVAAESKPKKEKE